MVAAATRSREPSRAVDPAKNHKKQETKMIRYDVVAAALALVSWKSVRMCERAVGLKPPVAGTEPVAPKGDRVCKRARDSSGVFLNPNSCKGFEPEPSKEGSG
jgi:hypothetical protein